MTATTLISLILMGAAPQAMPTMDHAVPSCPATPAPLPAGLEGWARQRPVRAGANAARASMIAIGDGFAATLLPTPRVTYALPPEKPGGLVSNGGMFVFTVATAGRYRVALGAGAWIDVLNNLTPLVSVAHGHGPVCSGVRKMVDFDLKPGRHLLQVAGSPTATLPLMVARLP